MDGKGGVKAWRSFTGSSGEASGRASASPRISEGFAGARRVSALAPLVLGASSVPVTTYVDRNFLKRGNTRGNYLEALRKSTTVYVGNLSFYTSEDQIYEIFSKCGDIRRIIMGLDKFQSTPCGFCFVLFYTREDTEHAVKYLNGTVLDGRIIRVDIDWGFEEGRQYGAGTHCVSPLPCTPPPVARASPQLARFSVLRFVHAGRGRSGGQVRDELRDDYDADRGGWGRIVEDEMTAEYVSAGCE